MAAVPAPKIEADIAFTADESDRMSEITLGALKISGGLFDCWEGKFPDVSLLVAKIFVLALVSKRFGMVALLLLVVALVKKCTDFELLVFEVLLYYFEGGGLLESIDEIGFVPPKEKTESDYLLV